jgi:hypothetical protein
VPKVWALGLLEYTEGVDDQEFLRRLKQRIEESTGVSVELQLNLEEPGGIAVDFSLPVPKVVMGADALRYSGLARMFLQFIILCLREKRQVGQEEFLLFLRRN